MGKDSINGRRAPAPMHRGGEVDRVGERTTDFRREHAGNTRARRCHGAAAVYSGGDRTEQQTRIHVQSITKVSARNNAIPGAGGRLVLLQLHNTTGLITTTTDTTFAAFTTFTATFMMSAEIFH